MLLEEFLVHVPERLRTTPVACYFFFVWRIQKKISHAVALVGTRA
jgi:hypothetical protein